jgi:general secretion pathway protein D
VRTFGLSLLLSAMLFAPGEAGAQTAPPAPAPPSPATPGPRRLPGTVARPPVGPAAGEGPPGGKVGVPGAGAPAGAAPPGAGGAAGAGGTAGGAAGAAGGAPGAAGAAGATSGKPGEANLPQFEEGVEFQPKGPNYKVAFSLEDADLPELVRFIGQLTGKRFIFGSKLHNIKASIYAPQKITVAEAYQAFLSILETNGLTVIPHGRFLKIVETGGVATQSTPLYVAGEGGAPAEDRYVTRIHRLGHVNAEEVATVLGHFKTKDGDITAYAPGNLLIITDTGSNIRRMMQIVEDIDVGSAGDQIWIEPVHYASASDIANRINELFDIKGGAAPAAGGAGKGAPHEGAGAGGELHISKLLADDRSNSIVIVATERAYLRILEIIKRLDVPQTGEGEIHVLPLQHADATELTKTLQEIITGAGAASAPGGAAAPAPKAGASSGIFEGGVKVSADKATNSIVITSSVRDYASLRAVVDRLDLARKQVFIDAVVMDLSVKRSNSFGVNFHAADTAGLVGPGDSLLYGGLNPLKTILLPDPTSLQGMALGVRGPGIPGSENLLGTGLTIPAFGVLINALASDGDADVLSTPHILATDNIAAEINVGENIPLQTNGGLTLPGLPGGTGGTTPGAGGLPGGFGFPAFGSSGARSDVGTKIKIIPHLNDSNEVRLELTEEISEAQAPTGQLGVVPITKRNATTQLVVRDQQTVVIGGLMRNRLTHTQDKIPVLGDIPVLGALFRTTTDTMQKTNLLLILTPFIIREQSDLRTVFERKMQERQEFLDRYFVFSDRDYQPPHDWSRANGLLEEIRQSYISVEERKRLDDLAKPKEFRGHAPGEPLEMPATVHTTSAAPAPAANPPVVNAPAPAPLVPGINIAPQPRSVEKIEK